MNDDNFSTQPEESAPAARSKGPPSRGEEAVSLALLGWHVFPVWGVRAGKCECGNPECAHPGKHPVSRLVSHGHKDASRAVLTVQKWWTQGEWNVGAYLAASGLVALDLDPRNGSEETSSHLVAELGGLPPTVESRTGGGGRHLVFVAGDGSYVGNLGPGVDVKHDGYIVLPPSSHFSGGVYEWALRSSPVEREPAELPPSWRERVGKPGAAGRPSSSRRDRRSGHTTPIGETIPDGFRNDELASLAGSMRHRGMGEAEILPALLETNRLRCQPPLAEDEVEQIAASIGRYEPAVPTGRCAQRERWPAPPAAEAFHGLVGEIVRAIEPHSEADSAALLLQTLAAVGNAAGRSARMLAEKDEHPAGLFVLLVGETAKARKGTSWGRVRQFFELAGPDWLLGCVTSGAISGEGMVWEVRDPIITRRKARKDEHDHADGYGLIEEITDAGVEDKRRLWYASEFASILQPARRDTNTLTCVIRDAWDKADWRTAAKNSPARVTGAHTSIIAHITAHELTGLLSVGDRFNGFANRFLFVCVKRSKCLPEPTQPDPKLVSVLAGRLREAINFAHAQREVVRDEQARVRWAEAYPKLSAGLPGLLGAITSRAEAQVLRLSLTYALLDCSPVVRREHLDAGLAVWAYCERSAAFLFGDATGNPLADKLLAMLVDVGGAGLSLSQIRDEVGGRVPAEKIDAALELLREHRRARVEVQPTGGRPATRWFAVERTEQTERSPSSDEVSSVPSVSSTVRGTNEEHESNAAQGQGAFSTAKTEPDRERWLRGK